MQGTIEVHAGWPALKKFALQLKLYRNHCRECSGTDVPVYTSKLCKLLISRFSQKESSHEAVGLPYRDSGRSLPIWDDIWTGRPVRHDGRKQNQQLTKPRPERSSPGAHHEGSAPPAGHAAVLQRLRQSRIP